MPSRGDATAQLAGQVRPRLVRHEIVLQDDGLALRRRERGVEPPSMLGPDHVGGPFRLRFDRDEDGRVSGFRLTTGRVLELRFDRLEAR